MPPSAPSFRASRIEPVHQPRSYASLVGQRDDMPIFAGSIEIDAPRDAASIGQTVAEFSEQLPQPGAIQVWLPAVSDGEDDVLAELGFVPYRDLWQLRTDLPAEPSTLDTRPFSVDDVSAFLAVNNRAFSWHPEQGGMTVADVEQRMAEPWFDAEGFRLFEVDDRLAGFCWTKIHANEEPPLGEIYAIAVDPDFHGQGLGAPMTRSGLDWLSAQGLEIGMLYVESDNHAANAAYSRIGFTRYQTNRAYRPRVVPS